MHGSRGGRGTTIRDEEKKKRRGRAKKLIKAGSYTGAPHLMEDNLLLPPPPTLIVPYRSTKGRTTKGSQEKVTARLSKELNLKELRISIGTRATV